MSAAVLSVNVGLPRDVPWDGKPVRTGIFKSPAAGPVRVGRLNLEGDGQGDLTVHGGLHKAVYAYPSEHYDRWRVELGEPDLAWAAFGENLTVRGFTEGSVKIGDRLLAGTAELVVTQPRFPCFKLGIRFGRPDMERRFLRSGLTGFYLSVAREGTVAAGDAVTLLEAAADSMTVAEIVDLYRAEGGLDRALVLKASQLAGLPEGLRNHFRKRLLMPGLRMPG